MPSKSFDFEEHDTFICSRMPDCHRGWTTNHERKRNKPRNEHLWIARKNVPVDRTP